MKDKNSENPNPEKLWALLKQIPRGKVTTYKVLAKKLNSHPRAIGKMLNSNPHPVAVPCHRVVMSDGRIGGYKLGIEKKIGLLRSEDVEILDGAVDLIKFSFEFGDS